MSLFDGEGALAINSSVKTIQGHELSIFALAFYNSLKGLDGHSDGFIKLHPKKDKQLILSYIFKAHQDYPKALKALALLVCHLNVGYSYILDALIELGYLNLNDYFPLEEVLHYCPMALGCTPLMFIQDAKVIQYLTQSYFIDYAILHGGQEFFLQSKEKIEVFYSEKSFIYQKIKDKSWKLNQLALLGQTIKQKQQKKMQVVKASCLDLNTEEAGLLSHIFKAKNIYQQYLLVNQAIFSNNQTVLKHLGDELFIPILNYQQGSSNTNLLIKAVEYENIDYLKFLIHCGIYQKEQVHSILTNESLLFFAIKHKLNKSAIYLFENHFYPDSYHINDIIDFSKKNKDMIQFFYKHCPNHVTLELLFLSKNEQLLLEHLQTTHVSIKEAILFYTQYQYYIIYHKEQNKRILYHSNYTTMLINIMNFICQKEQNFNCYEQFESHIKYNFVKNRRGVLHKKGYHNVDEQQLFILYSTIQSIIPNKARSFLSLLQCLLPDNTTLFKTEKKQLEELVFQSSQKTEDLKRIKI